MKGPRDCSQSQLVAGEGGPTDEAEYLHPRPGSWTSAGRLYVLAVLCVIGVFNLLDRQIISVVLQPIKVEFGASDTVGFITGFLFSAFYAMAALPVARLLDRRPRKQVLAAWFVVQRPGGA